MTASRRLRILRIRRQANLLTAQAFEDLFDRQFASIFDVSFAPLEPWCDAVLGTLASPFDLAATAARFGGAMAGYDFFCASYECIPLLPLLVAARNRSRSTVRLLFIAHAPGIYSFEWALLRPLLAAGDVIIAPSESARRVIEYQCPALAPFVRMIPHPMARLQRTSAPPHPPRIATLGRIHAQKLMHRLVEAMAILRERRGRAVQLDIGGSLDDGGWQGPHPYTRTLQEKVRRLRLDDSVTFIGPVRGDVAKGAFLCSADVLVNLSVTIEESFGKAPVEALGVGVPVVATDWVGLRNTVGSCGRLVPVVSSTDIVGAVDVEAQRVADAIESVLDAPPPAEQCLAWTDQFSPSEILPRYRAALEDAATDGRRPGALPEWPDADVGAAPAAGLLADAAPLNAFSWRDLFDTHLGLCDSVRRGWSGDGGLTLNEGVCVRGVLLGAVESSLKHFCANLVPPLMPTRSTRRRPRSGALDVLGRLEHAAHDGGLLPGRAACVRELIAAGRLSAAAAALEAIAAAGFDPTLVAFWRSELAAAAGDTPAALAHALDATRGQDLGESDWPLVRQVARAARRAAVPGIALPVVLAWLDRFPDSQESGPLWLDACVNGIRAGDQSVENAERYHARARALLGDLPAVQQCGALVVRTRRATELIA